MADDRVLTFDENSAVHMAAHRIKIECERMMSETLKAEITTGMATNFFAYITGQIDDGLPEVMPESR